MRRNIICTMSVLSIFICILALGVTSIPEDVLHEPVINASAETEAVAEKIEAADVVDVIDSNGDSISLNEIDEDSYSGFTFMSERNLEGDGIRHLGGNIYAADSLDVIAEFKDEVECVEPSYNLKLMNFSPYPNDEYYGKQGNLKQMKVPAAWKLGLYGTEDVIVAVIDTGFTFNHPDVDMNKVLKGKSFAKGATSVSDSKGHGTMVAGIIAANQNNGIGVAGIAPGITLLPIRIFNAAGNTTDEAVISAIFYAVDKGADVINMSFGGEDNNKSLEAACKYAQSKGCILIAAAGNEGEKGDKAFDPMYPAAYSCVIGVGSVDANGKVSSFSQKKGVYVVAPGERMSSITRTGSYVADSAITRGTSFSCPEVSALAAMAKSVNMGYTNSEFKRLLRQTSDNTTADWNKEYGYGVVNFETAARVLSGKRDTLTASDVSIEYTRTPYTGKSRKPAVTVKYNGKTLKKDDDYSVLYINNTEIGTATVAVSGLGRYGGTVNVSFEIFDPEIIAEAEPSGTGEYKLSSYAESRLTAGLEPGARANILADEVNISLSAALLAKTAPYGLTIKSPDGFIRLGAETLTKLSSSGYSSISFYFSEGELAVGALVDDGNIGLREYIDLMDGIKVTAGIACESSKTVAVRAGSVIYAGAKNDGYFEFETSKAGKYELKSCKAAAKEKLKTMKPEIAVSKGKVSIDTSVSQLKKTGYTVKYKYYRSVKKSSGYSLKKTTTSRSYTNTGLKKGKTYYYKAKICVYDGSSLIGSTTLSQCGAVKKKY